MSEKQDLLHGVDLSRFKALDQYQSKLDHIFPSLSSFQWWLRSNRRGAIEAGALVLVRGRYYVDPQKMDAYVADVAQQAARRHLVPA